jgi:1-acyl-sn-glycerol-3-phosphate acyltransferase
MKNMLKHIWTVYFSIMFILSFAILYPAFLVLLSKKKWYNSAQKLRRVWGVILLFITGIRSEVTYEEPLDKNKTYVFTPNHFSYMDIVTIGTLLPHLFGFMAKKELASIPLFRVFFRSIDMPVDRKSMEGAKRAYYLANKKLNEGMSLINFPEGGIGDNPPVMRRFKLGAFKLAMEHNLEIVPITLADNWKRLPIDGNFIPKGTPGKMRMHVHRPISTENLKGGDELKLAGDVYAIIEQKMNELNGL